MFQTVKYINPLSRGLARGLCVPARRDALPAGHEPPGADPRRSQRAPRGVEDSGVKPLSKRRIKVLARLDLFFDGFARALGWGTGIIIGILIYRLITP